MVPVIHIFGNDHCSGMQGKHGVPFYFKCPEGAALHHRQVKLWKLCDELGVSVTVQVPCTGFSRNQFNILLIARVNSNTEYLQLLSDIKLFLILDRKSTRLNSSH